MGPKGINEGRNSGNDHPLSWFRRCSREHGYLSTNSNKKHKKKGDILETNIVKAKIVPLPLDKVDKTILSILDIMDERKCHCRT